MSKRRLWQFLGGTLTVWAVTLITVFLGADKLTLLWGDAFGLGQFIIEFLLVPPVIFGLIVGLLEFRSLTSKARPNLWFQHENMYFKSSAFPLKEQNGSNKTYLLAIGNDGSAVTEWWSVWISMPLTIFNGVAPSNQWGSRIPGGRWESKRIEDRHIHMFYSAGEVALYPESRRTLAQFSVNRGKFQEGEEVIIHFNIYTNRGPKKSGKLHLLPLPSSEEVTIGYKWGQDKGIWSYPEDDNPYLDLQDRK